MNHDDRVRETCELLKLYVYIEKNYPDWFNALLYLRERINTLYYE